jgi:hypothetical protein
MGDVMVGQFFELSIEFSKRELHESRRLVWYLQLVRLWNIRFWQNRIEAQLAGFAISRHTIHRRATAYEYLALKDQQSRSEVQFRFGEGRGRRTSPNSISAFIAGERSSRPGLLPDCGCAVVFQARHRRDHHDAHSAGPVRTSIH